jgi:hypothetical protein
MWLREKEGVVVVLATAAAVGFGFRSLLSVSFAES